MEESPAKRIKTSSPVNHNPNRTTPTPKSPRSIVTWNCNGLISRSLYNLNDLERLVRETQEPDCFCIQEVRLKALCSTQRGMPKPLELNLVKPALSTVFQDYVPYWSLSDARYAGTLTLLHKRLVSTNSEIQTAFTPSSAIELLLKMFSVTRGDVGLPEQEATASSGTKSKTTPIQTSMTKFFSVKPKPHAETDVSRASRSSSSNFQHHNCEGRFQFFAFHDMDLIQTYVPNNGINKEESVQRRQQWDIEMLQFLQARSAIIKHASSKAAAAVQDTKSQKEKNPHRTLLWCGDMNCARDYRDGTHWEDRSTLDSSSVPYEWWTDETQCFVQPSSSIPTTPRNQPCSTDNRGMPSFTPGERRRFESLLEAGNLVDVWRDLHPNGSDCRSCKHCSSSFQDKVASWSQWDFPNWTWRGHLGKNKVRSKYEGKGQRLDYFLKSPYDRESVEKCEILGYSSQREGLFCGSDHCASLLVLKTL